jgi:hypothetical protein
VSDCEVLSDGVAIHVVWLKAQEPDFAPNALILRHALFVNNQLTATHVVDLTPDLLP